MQKRAVPCDISVIIELFEKRKLYYFRDDKYCDFGIQKS